MRTSLIVALLWAVPVAAQVTAPPPPKSVHVEIRYRIQSDRDGRVRLFRAMTAELNALGFVADPKEDADLDILDPSADRLSGTIDSNKLQQLLKVTAVQSVLAWPAGAKLPDHAAKPVQLTLQIASGLDPTTQRHLHEQIIAQLEKLGFVNAIGYDDRNFTRVRGAIPAGQVTTLLKDLRGLPAGWLLQETPREKLPQPLRSVLPIQIIEVLPDLEAFAKPAVATANPKYASDLRFALADPAFAAKPFRVEASLNAPIESFKEFRQRMQFHLPGALLEGVVGTMATFQVKTVKDLEALAAMPEVLTVRLPAKATNTVKPGTSAGNALGATRINYLHDRGDRGQGRTIVVVGGGFDRAALPQSAAVVDLTAALSPGMEPAAIDPTYDATAAALAARAAAPRANLVCVRIDPAAFHQLFTVARAALGDLTLSNAQVARAEVLLKQYDEINQRREYLTAEYAEAFANLSDDEKPKARREKVQAEMVKLKAEEAAFREKYDRFLSMRKGLESVSGAAAIVNTLVWDDGYPADGMSEFAQLLDEKFMPAGARKRNAALIPTWVQAASESTWSVWAGPAHDRDGDRVMEFADASTPLPVGTWTRELNFLARLAADGTAHADLPAGAKLRIAIQWREPHDPNVVQTGGPMIGFRLQLLKQYDPSGKTTASDDLTEVASSDGPTVRLMMTPSAGVYEQCLEVTVPSAGRYALRVTMVAGTVSRFAAETQLAEIYPKITLRGLAGFDGRPIFSTFVAGNAGVGVPADAAGAFTVGRANAQGQSLSLLGAGPGLRLRNKPDVLLFGDGSGGAAGTAAGLAAILADLGVRPAQLAGTTAIPANGMLALPADWIDSLPRR